MKASTQIDAFLTFLRDCQQQYHMAVSEEEEANDITNDLHHFMEFGDENPEDLLTMSRALVEARRRRRVAKSTISELTPILNWLEEYRSVVQTLEALLGSVRKAERKNENRIYTPRVLTGPPDLKTEEKS